MKTNVLNLFEFENGGDDYSRKSKSQERFESVMIEHLPTIVDCIESAFDDMRRELEDRKPSYLNHLSKPNRMNEQIKGKISDAFGSKVIKLPYNRFGLLVEGYAILFKKLDKFGRPSNIKTANSLRLATQGKLNLTGEPEIVYVGYLSDPGLGSIKKISAVKIEDQEVQWSINLKSIIAGTLTISKPPVIETDDLKVTFKKSTKKNKKSG